MLVLKQSIRKEKAGIILYTKYVRQLALKTNDLINK